MNQTEDRFEKAFAALSGAGPEGAPASVESNLKAAFRRHHARRRRRRHAILALTIGTCAIITGTVILRSRSVRVQPDHPLVAGYKPVPSAPVQKPSPDASSTKPTFEPKIVRKSIKPARGRPALPAPDSKFISLPSYVAAFSDGGVRIVRVNLSNSDLYQMGAPELSYPGASRTVADVMFDRDGIPIAVRRVAK